MSRAAFTRILGTTVKNAGYSCSVTIHAIRRNLGHEVDSGSPDAGEILLKIDSETYTAVQRSQHVIQADMRIFRVSYMAHTSPMDGQGAFLREPARHDHITFFHSFERFHWIGLPTELSLEKKEAINRDPAVLELEGQMATLTK